MKFSIAVVTVLLLTVTACDDAADSALPPDQSAPEPVNTIPYPEDMRATFMNTCIDNGGTDAMCQCVLAEMEKAIPPDDMLAVGQQRQPSDGLPERYAEAMVEANVRCALESIDDAPPADGPVTVPDGIEPTVRQPIDNQVPAQSDGDAPGTPSAP